MTETRDTLSIASERDAGGAVLPVLVVAWAEDPSLVGAIVNLTRPHERSTFGRGSRSPSDPLPRVLLARQRPSDTREVALASDFVSKHQLALTLDDTSIEVENTGKRALLDGAGVARDALRVEVGDVIEIKGQMVLVCAARPAELPSLKSGRVDRAHVFGQADEAGFVGESPAAWALRDQIAFVAGRRAHVLLLGDSGAGKELVARALHRLSDRKGRAMVSRNAATLPAGIADAELFGNAANYPNSGTAERPGLIGEANGSTLFFDEIGELPEELQAKLLRVLDEGGEYQRLGDARRRQSDLRFIGATNRPLEALKHDVAARLRLRVTVPGLSTRREDIMLVALHIMRRIAAEDDEVARRFMQDGTPRLEPALVRALVGHEYRTHVRELEGLLWSSMAAAPGQVLTLSDEVRAQLVPQERADARDIGEQDVRKALERVGGVREKAWRELGLANRYVLARLMKKYNID